MNDKNEWFMVELKGYVKVQANDFEDAARLAKLAVKQGNPLRELEPVSAELIE